MLDRPTLITLSIALVGGCLALVVERLFKRGWLTGQLLVVVWAISWLLAFYLQYERQPPMPFTAAAADAESWELMLWPLVIVSGTWLSIARSKRLDASWPWWIAMSLSAIVLSLAAPVAQHQQALQATNVPWHLAGLLAIGVNYLSIHRMADSGAGRWVMLVPLAQLLIATALVMTCFGSWGDWCRQISLALAVLVCLRMIVYPQTTEQSNPINGHGEWFAICMIVPAVTLPAGIMIHIRDYSDIALPVWLAPVALLMPTLIGLVDYSLGARRGTWTRVIIAAGTAIVLGAVILAIVLIG